MSLTSYAGLVTFMERVLNRSDQSAYFPDFLAMAEAHFNREIRCPLMEATSTASTSTATIALPTDFLAAREVYIDGTNDTVLIPMPAAQLRGHYAMDAAGEPEAYAITGSNIVLAPAPSSAVTIGLAYWQQIPPLTATNTSNWLLAAHPDLYVWAIRYYAAEDAMDEALAARCLANVGGLIEGINRASIKRMAPAGPMAMRPAVSE